MNAPVRDGDWLRATVAVCLQVPPESLELHVPLTHYGLDSLSAVEIATALSAATGRDVPASALFDCPSLDALAAQLASPDAAVDRALARARMLEDAALPAAIRPSPQRAAWPPRAMLVTGASGFLGAHLVHALLRLSAGRVVALARAPSDAEALERVRRALAGYRLWAPSFESRLAAVAADLCALGALAERLDALEIDAIYHCAAAVNWVLPYAGLREANVLATRELVAAACRGRAIPFHFVSSAAVCYATDGPPAVSEDDDMLPRVADLPLGYAQTKCVAEALVREAARRGLPATIVRPSLISGAAASGISNADDLVSRVIRACVGMGCAPDLDWTLDLCPVDFAAAAIARFSLEPRAGLRVHHLANPAARTWREAVLWMNLYGYPVRLIPYADWVERLEPAADAAHPLHALAPFFRTRTASGLFLPELYEASRRSRFDCAATREALGARGMECPPLSASLLDRYFAEFVARGALPAVARRGSSATRGAPRAAGALASLLRRALGDESLDISAATRLALGTEDSIVSELAGWKAGAATGLERWRVDLRRGTACPRTLDLVIKTKPRDEAAMEVGTAVAYLAGDRLGDAFSRHRAGTGLALSHVREAAIYAQRDPRFIRHAPRAYGALEGHTAGDHTAGDHTAGDDAAGHWVLVLEHVADARPGRGAGAAARWQREEIEAAIAGVAELHAIWWRRERALQAQPWIGTVMTAEKMRSMTELWTAAAEHSQRFFVDWAGHPVVAAQTRLIAGLGDWWRELEAAPRTLIHNDFNPRNLALRGGPEALVLCAYDWELATLGLPQHDLAELLCFVLDARCGREEVLHYVEAHRSGLERASGEPLAPAAWRRGFALALADLIVNRLPMYAMVHAVRPQAFLPRVVRTWRRLHELFPE